MKILFLCTHNACRSVLSEVISRHLANGQLEVASAGSQPSGKVHPETLRHLQDRGYSTDNLHSKGFDDLADFKPDAVITVCDRAAKEPCPPMAWFSGESPLGTARPNARVIGQENG